MSYKVYYRRVLIKLSGEALMGANDFGLSVDVLAQTAAEIKAVSALGVEVGIVVGGGNFLRGGTLAESGMNRVTGDQIGMLATTMNALALEDALTQIDTPASTFAAIELSGIARRFHHKEAIGAMQSGSVAIFAGGTGNPFFTTDTAACLRGVEIGADLVIKATKVDGVYDKDPIKFADAKRFDTLSYDQVIKQKLAVMDISAIVLCQNHQMPLRVLDMTQKGHLSDAMCDIHIGTLIRENHD